MAKKHFRPRIMGRNEIYWFVICVMGGGAAKKPEPYDT